MRSFLVVMRKMRMLPVMRMSSMMSDCLVGSSIALLPFWCLGAKGGEVVLLGFALGWEFEFASS
jgi:hypothetical protein